MLLEGQKDVGKQPMFQKLYPYESSKRIFPRLYIIHDTGWA